MKVLSKDKYVEIWKEKRKEKRKLLRESTQDKPFLDALSFLSISNKVNTVPNLGTTHNNCKI